jgi:hypothetical protein
MLELKQIHPPVLPAEFTGHYARYASAMIQAARYLELLSKDKVTATLLYTAGASCPTITVVVREARSGNLVRTVLNEGELLAMAEAFRIALV